MTKYKEYLRAKGIKLECDYECLPCGYIEGVTTKVMDGCVVAVVYSNCAGAEYVVYDRSGECSYFDGDGYKAYITGSHCDPEYIAWLRDVGFSKHAFVFGWMKRRYCTDREVRIAFKHMRAGIMSEAALCSLLARRYKKILGCYGAYYADAAKFTLPTQKDCAPAPSEGYAGNTDHSVDYKAYKVTKKQLDYLTYLLARYGDSSKTPRQLNPAEVSKSIKILKARSIHDVGRSYNATEKRKEIVKEQYLKKLYALING